MKKIFLLLFLSLSILGFSQSKEEELKNFIQSCERDSLLKNSIWGLKVVDLNSGKTLASHSPSYPLVPASTVKAITCASGFHLLGENFKWETKLGLNGEIKDSTLYGSLHVIGGGDPTSGTTVVENTSDVFKEFAKKLKSRGINKIVGNIIADDSYFPQESCNNAWLWEDIGAYYGTKTNSLCYYENKYTVYLSSLNGKVEILSIYPEIPNFEYVNEITIGEKTELYTYTNPILGGLQYFKGTIAPNKEKIKLEGANLQAPETFIYNFVKYLKKNDFDVSSVKQSINSNSQSPYILIGSVPSPSYSEVAKYALKKSNNLFCEQILRTVGKKGLGSKLKEALETEIIFLENELKLYTERITIVDGSGLARKNHISANFFCAFLNAMYKSKNKNTFIKALNPPKGFDGLVFSKSGSMSGVRANVGYIFANNEAYSFAFIINGYNVKGSEAQKRINEFFKIMTEQ